GGSKFKMAFFGPLKPWVQILVPDPCFYEFFVNFNFFEVECLKIVISKCLGYAIILGAVLVKLPQIIKLLSAKSAEGLSFASVILELLAVSASTSYGYAMNFPFSSYGEGIFLVLQTAIIGFLILVYSDKLSQALIFITVYTATIGFLLSPSAPLSLLWGLQAANMPVVAMAKMIQALENFRNGSTGQLSAITVMLLFLGSVARILTSIQETGDLMMILTYVVSTICNGIITFQMAIYWNSGKEKQKTN
ncbi:unnamed protein product, partial [Owenia fusiformis]